MKARDYIRHLSTHISAPVAWKFLEHVVGLSQAQIIAQDSDLHPEQEAQLAELQHRLLVNHEPLEYILGEINFAGCRIRIRKPMLVPRPETEEWVERLLTTTLPKKILDLCTGTGCIAIALAKKFPSASVVASDINPDAVQLARENAQLNAVTNLEIMTSDLFSEIREQQFDVITANPPYISAADYATLEPNVQRWEDPRALIGGEQGHEIIQKIIAQAPDFLRSGGQLWMEIGIGQESCRQLFDAKTWASVELLHDSAQIPRVFVAQRL